MSPAVASPDLVTAPEAAHVLARYLVVVFHDLFVAARSADRIASHGQLLGECKPAEVGTPAMRAQIHGVGARVESWTAGRLQILVDGLANPAPPITPREVALP